MTSGSFPNTRTPTSVDADSARPSVANLDLRHLLAETHRRLADDDIEGMDVFVDSLKAARESLEPSDWQSLISDVIRPHPVRPRIYEEPFTRRAFEKPRGYPGDAPLLDLIYRDRPTGEPLTPLGERLHWWADRQPACRSVRERRRILASLIDQVAEDRPHPRILSLACGHLREAQHAKAVREHEIEEFVGIDQDAESLAVVDREQRAFRVRPVKMTIRRFLAAPTTLGSFDLVYAAGLYDYLIDSVAAALTRSMFAALRPGGTLLVANFAPELRDIGYMEAIMDWQLIYRREAEVARFASSIPAAEIAETCITRDSCENVVYLTLRKA